MTKFTRAAPLALAAIVAAAPAYAQDYMGVMNGMPLVLQRMPNGGYAGTANGLPLAIEPMPSNQPQGGWITIPDERADTFENCFRVAQQKMDIGVAESVCIGLGITKFHWTKEYMMEECVRIAMPLTQWPDELVRPGCERRYAVNYAKYGRR
jgi:hypothetical protein